MNQTENTEALVAEAEIISEEVVMEETVPDDAPPEPAGIDEALLSEAEGVQAVYPHFDLTAELSHPVLGAILRGEAKPTLRQLYEAVHLEDILESRVAVGVQAQVDKAVNDAVAEAVAEAIQQ